MLTSAWMKLIGSSSLTARKNRPWTGCDQVPSAKVSNRSHRGRSLGCGRRPKIEAPRVASMFSPSTRT